MFGCGLPVAAKGFPALPELVKDGINGTIFHTQEELATQVNNVISINGFKDTAFHISNQIRNHS
jgi:hypothetical protein